MGKLCLMGEIKVEEISSKYEYGEKADGYAG